jgi:hypothetical protein
VALELLAAHHHGVPRAVLLGLRGKLDTGSTGECGPHQFLAVADDNDRTFNPSGSE